MKMSGENSLIFIFVITIQFYRQVHSQEKMSDVGKSVYIHHLFYTMIVQNAFHASHSFLDLGFFTWRYILRYTPRKIFPERPYFFQGHLWI